MLQLKDTVDFPGISTGGMALSLSQTNVSCGNSNNGAASVSVKQAVPQHILITGNRVEAQTHPLAD